MKPGMASGPSPPFGGDTLSEGGLMRKPVSKHALRRAMEKVEAEGRIEWKEPVGAVVDRIWHEIERESYTGGRKVAPEPEPARAPGLDAGPVEGLDR